MGDWTSKTVSVLSARNSEIGGFLLTLLLTNSNRIFSYPTLQDALLSPLPL